MKTAYYYMCFTILISFIFTSYVNADEIKINNNDFYSQNKIKNSINELRDHDIKEILTDSKKTPLELFYTILECKNRGINLIGGDKLLLDVSIKLINSNYHKICIEDRVGIALPTFLKYFTFNMDKDYDKIVLWWESNKINNIIDRDSWAVAAVDELLKGNYDNTAKHYITLITNNYRVKSQTKDEFQKWWIKNKIFTRREWILDSIEWAINNSDSNNQGIKGISMFTINMYINYDVLKELNLLSGKDEFIRDIDIDHRSKDKLKKWFTENRRTYNPYARDIRYPVLYWKF